MDSLNQGDRNKKEEVELTPSKVVKEETSSDLIAKRKRESINSNIQKSDKPFKIRKSLLPEIDFEDGEKLEVKWYVDDEENPEHFIIEWWPCTLRIPPALKANSNAPKVYTLEYEGKETPFGYFPAEKTRALFLCNNRLLDLNKQHSNILSSQRFVRMRDVTDNSHRDSVESDVEDMGEEEEGEDDPEDALTLDEWIHLFDDAMSEQGISIDSLEIDTPLDHDMKLLIVEEMKKYKDALLEKMMELSSRKEKDENSLVSLDDIKNITEEIGAQLAKKRRKKMDSSQLYY